LFNTTLLRNFCSKCLLRNEALYRYTYGHLRANPAFCPESRVNAFAEDHSSRRAPFLRKLLRSRVRSLACDCSRNLYKKKRRTVFGVPSDVATRHSEAVEFICTIVLHHKNYNRHPLQRPTSAERELTRTATQAASQRARISTKHLVR